MAFKDRLKEARLNLKFTQEQVAEKIGVAKSTFTGYEKGNSEPSMNTISKIMDALQVDANFLWQDEMNYPLPVKYDELNHIKKYRVLDEHGKDMVDTVLEKEHERVKQENIVQLPEYLEVNAAHARTDITPNDGEDTSDDDIMKNDKLWE